MEHLICVILIVAAAVAGALVGKKNPSLANAADKLVREGDAKAKALLAEAKAKLDA